LEAQFEVGLTWWAYELFLEVHRFGKDNNLLMLFHGGSVMAGNNPVLYFYLKSLVQQSYSVFSRNSVFSTDLLTKVV
jgi:hypothetical protein